MVGIRYFAGPIASAEQQQEQEVWVYAEDGRMARIQPLADTEVDLQADKVDASPLEVLEERGWTLVPPAELPLGGTTLSLSDTYHERWSRVWRYWITTPDDLLPGVRRFVAAAEAGGLPDDWTEQAAEDGAGTAHTVCSFSMSMDQARSLGAEQEALMALGSLPDNVHFFQRVASIDGFTGVEKESRQPDTLASQLYEPSVLFQTSYPDAGESRGTQWSEQDVLDTSGLTLI